MTDANSPGPAERFFEKQADGLAVARAIALNFLDAGEWTVLCEASKVLHYLAAKACVQDDFRLLTEGFLEREAAYK